MSNDMPEIRALIDKIQWACHDTVEESLIKELESHVQQLIKEAEERQRIKCADAVSGKWLTDVDKNQYMTEIKSLIQMILNAGGE